jgi:hypothetical protein
MKTSLISSLAFAGFFITIAPSTASAQPPLKGYVHSYPHHEKCLPYHSGFYGGIVLVNPVVEVPIVAEPAVDVYASLSFLPDDSEVVLIDGERCWFHDGCYYRHCDHGYKKVHCSGHEHIVHCSSHKVHKH